MPTYQYACTSSGCGNEFELVQSFTDPAASECPLCAGPVRKVFSAVGVVFKGSGFYRTDSRSGSTSAEAGSAKKEANKESAPAASSGSDGSAGSSSSAGGSAGTKAAASA